MRLYLSEIKLPSVRLERENPLPFFRTTRNINVAQSQTNPLLPEDLYGIGENTAFRILPYKMQDRYTRDKIEQSIPSIVLENKNLIATFLPEYGARLYSLYSKTKKRELLFKNPVLQFANLGIRNAWFSGGIEWNVSHFGHTFQTCSPVHALRCHDDKGNEFLRVYNFERCKEIYWQIDFHLPENSQNLHTYIRIINDKDTSESSYWWTNIALRETLETRIFSASPRVLYLEPSHQGGNSNTRVKSFGSGEMPYLPILPTTDASYPRNFVHSNEYFFQNKGSGCSWEAVVCKDGHIFFERSSARLQYRKMFCWGTHSGGQRWKDFLAKPGYGDYVEIQAGLAPTQLHGVEIPAQSTWDFVQVFGEMDELYQESFHAEQWSEASQKFAKILEQHIPHSEIVELETRYRELGQSDFREQIYTADGWGTLECRRRELTGKPFSIAGLAFPEDSLREEQKEWLHLLTHGFLKEPSGENPISWLLSEPWLTLLEQSLNKPKRQGQHWYTHLHLGVIYYEKQQYNTATSHWEQSIAYRKNPLAYRNLAYHYKESAEIEKALEYYRKVFSFPKVDYAYAEEYLEFLLELSEFAEVWNFYQKYKIDYISPKISVLVARAAVELEHDDYWKMLLTKQYPQLREGENWLTDIWFIAKAKQLAKEQNLKDGPELRTKVRKNYKPPAEIDFRME